MQLEQTALTTIYGALKPLCPNEDLAIPWIMASVGGGVKTLLWTTFQALKCYCALEEHVDLMDLRYLSYEIYSYIKTRYISQGIYKSESATMAYLIYITET